MFSSSPWKLKIIVKSMSHYCRTVAQNVVWLLEIVSILALILRGLAKLDLQQVMLLKCACPWFMFCGILRSTRYLLPEFNFIMLLCGHQYTCRNKLLVILCWLLVWLDPCDVIDCCYSVTPHHADAVWRTYLVSAMVYYMPVLPKKWCTDFYILSVCFVAFSSLIVNNNYWMRFLWYPE